MTTCYMLLSYKNHKPLRYKSQVKQQVSEASGSILVVDVVEPDLYDLNLRMLRQDHVRDIRLVAVCCFLLPFFDRSFAVSAVDLIHHGIESGLPVFLFLSFSSSSLRFFSSSSFWSAH